MENSGEASAIQFILPPTRLIQIKNASNKLISAKSIKTKQCRICLQSDQSQANQLITPCSCIGSIQYIHVKCFNTWVTRQYEQAENRQHFFSRDPLKCELCHQAYEFSYSTEFQCVSCRLLKNKMTRLPFLAAANVLFMIIAIILLAITSYYASYDKFSSDYNIENPRYFLVYVAMGFAIISLLYGVYQFIKLFMLQQKLILKPANKKKTKQLIKSHLNDTANYSTHPESNSRPFNNMVVQYLE